MEELPSFRYYPDPVDGGSLERSEAECAGCGRARGFACTSRAYGAEVPAGAQFCPWCIAAGVAHDRFGATFNEVAAGASPEATDEVERRTPGFLTWQDWEWPVHCGDVTIYLGQPRAGALRDHPDAWGALREEIRGHGWGSDDAEAAAFIDGLDPDAGAVAYLFRCRDCGTHIARWDME